MARKFSLTSANNIFIEMEKNGGEFFELKVGNTLVELTWSQLEIFKLGQGDLSESYLKDKDKNKET